MKRTPIAAVIGAALLTSIGGFCAAEAIDFEQDTPLGSVTEVVFAVRLKYDDPHWYANIGYYCDDENHKAYAGNGKPDMGRLCKLDLTSGGVTDLLHDPGGSVRDPQIHYDARKVLFSYRKSGTHHYHLYEINIDGSGLRQITSGPYDDYEPAYLPDGGIVFVSTRCNCWVNCWMTQVGVIHRCDADGGSIKRLSYNAEHDNTPWVLPDGRILYTRWEYVDRSQVAFHGLWTMNPDGTQQMAYYGNMHPRIVMIDAKPIPDSNKVMASFSPGHGRTDHMGTVAIVTPANGPDDLASARELHKGTNIEDPYPLSEDRLIAARGQEILEIDGQGRIRPIFTWQGEGNIREPRPVVPRPREKILAQRVDSESPTGTFVLADAGFGRNMDHPKARDIRKLLVLEVLPKQVNFSGGQDLTSWSGTFTLERVLGTVPVEKDGSAHFKAPAGRPVFFVALDENDLSVQRMQSFTSLMPGEVSACIGCHEHRTATPDANTSQDLLALRRAPSEIEPFEGFPDVMDFQRDIQPILDKHCVECHNPLKPEGHAILSGDLGPHWSHSYYSLLAHKQVADGRNGFGNQPPGSLGSAASPLLDKLRGDHYDVQASDREWRTVWLWIESGAPFAGSYAALRNEADQKIASEATFLALGKPREVLRRRCGDCHELEDRTKLDGMALPFQPNTRANNRGLDRRTAMYERVVLDDDPLRRFSDDILVNFTRPAMSPLLLGPLSKEAGGYGACGDVFKNTSDPDYKKLLAAIEDGKALLDKKPRYGQPGFRPNRQYIREMKRFGVLPESFQLGNEPFDVFEADQAYWRTFWRNSPR